MNKRRILAIAMSLCIVAILAVGASLAYFTDTDNATNTFTTGGVEIKLEEKQRKVVDGEKTTDLIDFGTDSKLLMPIVGSAQGEKDAIGMPTAKNYVDKMVTIKNTGSSAAYIRAYFAIPSALDAGYDEDFNASLNVLHFNFGNVVAADGTITSTYGNQWLWGTEAKEGHGGWNYFNTTINNIPYNVYYADYYKAVAPEEDTEMLIQGVYLDNHIDMKNGKYIDTRDAKGEADLSILEGKVSCPVFAVAAQADGFTSASEAITAAFGADYDPWNP